MSTLWRALGTDRGSATYHLNVLERAREIEALRTKRLTRFYPKETPDGERGAIAVLRHGRVQDVARLVRSRPGIAQHEITHTLPITRKVFRRYANLLIACDLLQETVRDQDRHYFPTPRLILLLEALGEGNTYGGRP